jgi:hypothetical protein
MHFDARKTETSVMSFALVGRCDGSGLASMSVEAHRHLHPARTLLIDLGERGRGDCSVESYVAHQYQGMEIYQTTFAGGLPTRALEWFCGPGVDTIYVPEYLYDSRLLPMAKQAGIRVVVHAMPELAPWATTAPQQLERSAPRPELAIPTRWREDTLPGARLLPVPVARDRLPYRQRTSVTHLHHVTGAAMLDRAGSAILLAALPHVTRDCLLTIRTERELIIPPAPHVDVEVLTDRTENYWESYPEMDLLVVPRRYGGLSLPFQEAASLGVPTLMLDSDPYASAPFAITIPSKPGRDAPMKGGIVPVFDADPRDLALMIDRAVVGELRETIASLSLGANAWAERHAWDSRLGAEWCSFLQADCAREEAA